MKNLSVVLTLPLAAVLVACGPSSGEIKKAKQDATARGFTVLSVDSGSDGFGDWLRLDVAFGEGGCTGSLDMKNNAELSMELPIPGAATETTYKQVTDAKVEALKGIAAFKHCFIIKPKG